jgi:hypothetical protein
VDLGGWWLGCLTSHYDLVPVGIHLYETAILEGSD